MNLHYTARDFTTTIGVEEYLARFRDAERFCELCRACPSYGRCWACPPFAEDPEPVMRSYRRVLLVATKITPEEAELPIDAARALIRPERLRIEQRLRQLELQFGARAYAYAGSCLYCPEGSCTRPEGLPCRHPDLARPSLEACGFDIGRTTAELFGIELQWGRQGAMPPYLTLVCGLFHNAGEVVW